MSRRPGDKAAQNQQTIKSLLKLEANKNCADCKKNKHPRWASWNLGIFICIRCSGIHRGMGTHISRVKSVDLDAWTDEQLQSVLRWGNGRANKYWEAKLAPGHVPSDAKMENFIRTKYEAKRWVMDGPIPDPSTLGDDGGDDNVPLNVVQEKAKLDRSSSQRTSSAPMAQQPQSRRAQPTFDLIGGDEPAPATIVRPSTTDTTSQASKPPPVKNQTPSQLLGGLDFLGAPPARPASATSSAKPAGMSRPDLKQSILSLYASAPKPQPPQSPPAQAPYDQQSSFGGMASTGVTGASGSGSAFGGMGDAFAGLNFGPSSSAPKPQQATQSKPSAFSGFGQASPPIKSTPAAAQMTSPHVSSPPLSGGGFFDAGPKPPPKSAATKMSTVPPPLATRKASNASDGFGDFGDFSSATTTTPAAAPKPTTSSLLDFTANPMPSKPTPSSNGGSSVFNLTQSKPAPQAAEQPKPAMPTNFASNLPSDPWGANEWAQPAPTKPAASAATPPVQSSTAGDFGWGNSPVATKPASSGWATTSTTASNAGANNAGGWGDSDAFGGGFASAPAVPKVAPEEDFGGWSSNTEPVKPTPPAATNSSSSGSKPLGGLDDPWANVWS